VPAGVAERGEGLDTPQTAHAAVGSRHKAKIVVARCTVCKSSVTISIFFKVARADATERSEAVACASRCRSSQ
jgi:hypothetical protein